MLSKKNMAISLSHGVVVELDLPEFSILDDSTDEGMAQCAALITPHFPVLRNIIISGINHRLSNFGNSVYGDIHA